MRSWNWSRAASITRRLPSNLAAVQRPCATKSRRSFPNLRSRAVPRRWRWLATRALDTKTCRWAHWRSALLLGKSAIERCPQRGPQAEKLAVSQNPTSRAYEHKHLVAGLQPAFLDHLRPLLAFVLDDSGKFGGRASDHRQAVVVEYLAYIRPRKNPQGRAMQAFEDRGRRSGRRQERMPHRRAEAFDAFLFHGRNIRRRRPARRGADRQRAQLAVARQRQRSRQAEERNRNAAADDIGHRHRDAAIRHVLEIDAGHELEQLGGEMIAGAGAAGCKRELTRIFARERNQFLHRLHRHVRVDQQDRGR